MSLKIKQQDRQSECVMMFATAQFEAFEESLALAADRQ